MIQGANRAPVGWRPREQRGRSGLWHPQSSDISLTFATPGSRGPHLPGARLLRK